MDGRFREGEGPGSLSEARKRQGLSCVGRSLPGARRREQGNGVSRPQGRPFRAVLGRESRWVFVVSGHRSRTRGRHGVEGFTSKEGSAFCQTALFHSRMGRMVGGERLSKELQDGAVGCIPRHWFPEIFWGKCVLRSEKLEKYLLLSPLGADVQCAFTCLRL